MFLAAIVRPHWDTSHNQLFDIKLGIWPFITHEPAKRHSRNRKAGTMVIKPITAMNSEVYQEFLIKKFLPLIVKKWLRNNQNIAIKI